MQKYLKAIAAIMLTVAVFCAAGCTKPDDPNNGGNDGGDGGGGSTPVLMDEGIYLGIIGFNQHQYEKSIGILNSSTQSSFTTFIDGFQMESLTGLYYADYLALQRMQSIGEPPKLSKVALVTFTDGLDNTSVSPATPELNPEHFPSKEAYLNALNSKIRNDIVYGYNINAYTIGLKGTDALSNLEEFRYNMQMLASSQSNVYEADNVNQVIDNFAVIADDLYSETATASLKLLLPGGYPDGLEMRYTFDDNSTPENSTLYIQCTYRNLGTAIRLENITYHGFNNGETTMDSNEVENGFMKFVFVDLTKNGGDLISESDKERLQVYKRTTTGWGLDSEFDKDQQSHIITNQKSAIVMLVLDCTTSLGAESFAKMKTAAKRFVEILVNSNNGGGNGGGNNPTFTIEATASPSDGGVVTGFGTYEQGQYCTVNATANSGYSFSNWAENGYVVSYNANYTFLVSANRNLVANFTYNNGVSEPPTGALKGLFTVDSNGKKIYFSKGNLQYQASTNTWRFAEHQWDYVGGTKLYSVQHYGTVNGSSNNNISPTYSGWIDLFGWGTSGYNHGAVCYQPWSTSTTDSDYYAYGVKRYNLYDQTGMADWGFNAIINGGNTVNAWHTPSFEEWAYIMNRRNTTSGIIYAKAIVADVKGLILLPDDWNTSVYYLNNANGYSAPYSSNIISYSQWTTLENAGAVFLPAAGERYEDHVGHLEPGTYDPEGIYWSSTFNPNTNGNEDDVASCWTFREDCCAPVGCWLASGNSVRLVYYAN